MNLVIGLILLFLVVQAIKQFGRMDAATAARIVRHGGGVLGMIGALLLLLRGRIGLAATVAGMMANFAGWKTTGGASTGFQNVGGGTRPGRASTARSAMVEMRLDHDTGAMTGTILAGAYGGRAIETLSRPELIALRQELARDDPDGVSLLEAYLDRRFAGWREADQGQRQGRGGHNPGPPDFDEEVSSRSWRLDHACRAGQSGQGCSDAASRLSNSESVRVSRGR
jgi:hypothetical protein